MTAVGFILFLLAGAMLFVLGFRGVVGAESPIRRVLAVNVMGNGVFLVFITLAARGPSVHPDPVPHAMVLTGIVVAVCATAVALTLAERWQTTLAETDEKAEK
jgi:multicomponent Na+:H+ antiporter subunit C